MTLYEVIVTYILPVFGDFTAYDGAALHAFHSIFCLVVTFIVLFFALWCPYKFMRWLGRGGAKKK